MDIRSLKIPRLGYMQNKEGMRKEYLGIYKDNAMLDSKELSEFTSGKLAE